VTYNLNIIYVSSLSINYKGLVRIDTY